MPSGRPVGRPKLTKDQRKRRGTLRPEKPAVDVRGQAGDCPEPPDWLEGHGRMEWERLAPFLRSQGLLTMLDANALAQYCHWTGEFVRLQMFLHKEGETYEVTTQNGTVVRPRPECEMMVKASRLAESYIRHFGLSPKARSVPLSVEPTAAKAEAAPKDPLGLMDDD